MTSPPFVYLARELQKAALAVACRPYQISLKLRAVNDLRLQACALLYGAAV